LEHALGPEQMEKLDHVLQTNLMDLGVHCVVLLDLAGNIIADINNGKANFDVYSLAALAAGNFGAVSTMAQMIGEEKISLLFHQGKKENIYFSKVMDDFLLVTIFGHDLSLGFIRLKVAEAITKISKIFVS
jgi:predicted regulator of Ras-like GTPase activity (Roadblock/LC7/MglB family)